MIRRAGVGVLPHQRTWLLAIGRRLKAEYDAIAEPVPPRLAALVKQLEMPSTRKEQPGRGGQAACGVNEQSCCRREADP